MGNFASEFQHGKTALEFTKYDRSYEPEWIVDHSRVSGLGILQVERLWQRFQQLGSTDGTLKSNQLPAKMKNDPISRMILANLVDKENKENSIRFLSYCNLMAWIDSADLASKKQAVFQFFGNGKNIDKDKLYAIMKVTFPNETEASVFKLTDILMRNLDDKQQGYITENQFIDFLDKIPASQLQKVLEFSIIPHYIDQNPKEQETIPETYRSSSEEHGKQIPTDFILMEISQKACRRDWYMLGNLLDFTSPQIAQFDTQHQEARDKCFAMLKSWRDKEGRNAHLIKLEKALRQSGMNDIAMMLHP